MRLLQSIAVNGRPGKYVELYEGDLTDLQPDEAFDLLVVSAFPNDYIPTSTSLIGALHKKGLSVASLAMTKADDLRESFSCWLSQEFSPSAKGLRFRRILCFEPNPIARGAPPEVVGDVFRALTPILGAHTDIKTIAMPVLASGDQNYPVTQILDPLLEAALQWLEHGLPLERIKIVAYSDKQAKEASALFSKKKEVYNRSAASSSAAEIEYDIFISYAREDSEQVEHLERVLARERPNTRIFLDRKDIDVGTPWQPQIFESLDKCHRVVVMFSPSYLNSKVCKEEFNIAWVRSRETEKDNIIFPMYIFSAELPTYMRYRGYVDCREGDKEKITQASKALVNALDAMVCS
jgi:hypothetical protein